MNRKTLPICIKGGLIALLILALIAIGENIYDYIYAPDVIEMEGLVTCFATLPACFFAYGVVDELISTGLAKPMYYILAILLYFLLGAFVGYLIQRIKDKK